MNTLRVPKVIKTKEQKEKNKMSYNLKRKCNNCEHISSCMLELVMENKNPETYICQNWKFAR